MLETGLAVQSLPKIDDLRRNSPRDAYRTIVHLQDESRHPPRASIAGLHW